MDIAWYRPPTPRESERGGFKPDCFSCSDWSDEKRSRSRASMDSFLFLSPVSDTCRMDTDALGKIRSRPEQILTDAYFSLVIR